MINNLWFWIVVIGVFTVIGCKLTDIYYEHFSRTALPVIEERPPYWTKYESPGTGAELPRCSCCSRYFALKDKLLIFPTDDDDLYYCHPCTKVNHREPQ